MKKKRIARVKVKLGKKGRAYLLIENVKQKQFHGFSWLHRWLDNKHTKKIIIEIER